jgi:hypothetical protein
MQVHDILNHQFMLYNHLDLDTVQYIENNNLNINYYCFFTTIIGNINYVITSKTIKKKDNGYRIITIMFNDIDAENKIFEYNSYLNIYHKNVHVKVSGILSSDDVSVIIPKIKITSINIKAIDGKTLDYKYNYDKDIDENQILNVISCRSDESLNNFTNLQTAQMSVFYGIREHVLPSTLQKLILRGCFTETYSGNMFPNSLQTLIFEGSFSIPFEINILPRSLKKLKFASDYNQLLKIGILPDLLQVLKFGSNYNQPFEVNVLPKSLISLCFGNYYNQSFGENVLPKSLISLCFGNYYNQPFTENILPNSLKTLKLGNRYNHPFCKNILPCLLKTLVLGSNYEHKFTKDAFPNSLQSLTLSQNYNQPIDDNVIPSSLQSVIFKNYRVPTIGVCTPDIYFLCDVHNKPLLPPTFTGTIRYTNHCDQNISQPAIIYY